MEPGLLGGVANVAANLESLARRYQGIGLAAGLLGVITQGNVPAIAGGLRRHDVDHPAAEPAGEVEAVEILLDEECRSSDGGVNAAVTAGAHAGEGIDEGTVEACGINRLLLCAGHGVTLSQHRRHVSDRHFLSRTGFWMHPALILVAILSFGWRRGRTPRGRWHLCRSNAEQLWALRCPLKD